MAELVNEASRSLKALNAWVDVIESNIAGSKRTAFKAARPSFGSSTKIMGVGGSDFHQRPLQQNAGDLFIPDAALTVTQMSMDMKQGEILNSDQDTHLAILGTGFFVATDKKSLSDDTKIYYTRDGEFHWDVDGNLRTADGLYVVNRKFPEYSIDRQAVMSNVTAGVPTDSVDNYFVNKTRTVGGLITQGPDLDEWGNIDINHVGMARFPNDGALLYSTFGTTVLEESSSSGMAMFFGADDPAGFATIKLKALETANASVTEFIPMLTVAQKAFGAIAKIIAVYNSTVDDMNNTIR